MADLLNVATAMSLSGRVGLVTGGGTGIGFMIAKAFAANGAKVYITGRRLEMLERAAASVIQAGVSGSIVPLRMNVIDEESVKAGAQYIEGIDGKLDILVNNAVFSSSRDPDFDAKKLAASDPFEPETVQNWMDIFALNTIAPFFVVRAFQSLLIKGAHSRPQGKSSVINISSPAAKISPPMKVGCLAYGATKAALEKLTLVLGTSFAGRGIPIRVNALEPGLFLSEMITPEVMSMFNAEPLPGSGASILMGRPGTDAEMGMAAIYSAVSGYTNGAILSVDGGIALVNP